MEHLNKGQQGYQIKANLDTNQTKKIMRTKIVAGNWK